jgi:hypothetical protein
MSKNLVIAAVGDSSLHNKWIESKGFKSFDVFLIYYGFLKDRYFSDCEYYSQEKGYKFPLIYKHLHHTKIHTKYDYFWLPDDDILASTADINLLFQLMKSGFYIAQPSIKKECHHTWPHTTCQQGKVARMTKFVEIMCPAFSYEALEEFLPHFNETKTGWGLDYLWSTRAVEANKKMAIFDIVSVSHTRKMGEGDLYKNLRTDGIQYKQDLADFLKKHELKLIPQRNKKEDY